MLCDYLKKEKEKKLHILDVCNYDCGRGGYKLPLLLHFPLIFPTVSCTSDPACLCVGG